MFKIKLKLNPERNCKRLELIEVENLQVLSSKNIVRAVGLKDI